jgi:heat shock protein HslJ
MNRIRFSQMISTMMACPEMEVERQLAEVLGTADSYILQGDKLQLIRARMAPLAKFEAVYMK